MDTPPVVCKYIEDAQNENEERRRPFRLESNSNHHASHQAEDRDEYSGDAPRALQNEAEE